MGNPVLLLDQECICVPFGFACLTDSYEPSHVVRAMKPDSSALRQLVRVSTGPTTTISVIESTVAAVRYAVAALNS